ncbi:PTS glucose transporter subunit IIA [Leuconostoc fallax]|uniref:PTS glucose transporter subunit IIA n=1 Tax=Leuconostoc fallax TaxID=1251 RepID=UPI002091D79B|nr:PTS glucose transporter subunit IIA [Leuconostoc fallax]MCO6183631.1 PTS glucose transporter subunit IIA [Leuconostoc fallax]
MDWWRKLRRLRKSKLVTISRHHSDMQPLHMAKTAHDIALVAPATGQMQPLINSNLELFRNKMMGDGVMIWPIGGNIIAPVSGIVTNSSSEQLNIKTADDKEVILTFGGENIGIAHLARYLAGQQLHAGDTIGTLNQNMLAAYPKGIDIYVIWTNNNVPSMTYGSVYAGQNIWKINGDSDYEASTDD